MTRAVKSVPIGPLSSRSADNKHWVEPKRDFPVPTKVCNSTATGTYHGPQWNLRPGAEAHKQFKSSGQGC